MEEKRSLIKLILATVQMIYTERKFLFYERKDSVKSELYIFQRLFMTAACLLEGMENDVRNKLDPNFFLSEKFVFIFEENHCHVH